MGFEWIKGGTTAQQEALLGSLLLLSVKDQPIVLHVRGGTEDLFGTMAFRHCLRFLEGKVLREQLIQLHSFHGTVEVMREWLQAFPNTYFSFSGMVQRFAPDQLETLSLVPVDRMLVETDSPYLALKSSGRRNSPLYIGDIVEQIASVRGVDPELLASQTTRNGRDFFKV